MKKLFTLVVAAFAVVGAFAQVKNVGEPLNNVKDDAGNVWYDQDTKTITFHSNGSYRPGWWLAGWDNDAGKNVPADYSNYDEFVVELDNPNGVNINVRVEYEDADASNGNSKGNEIVVPLNKDAAKKLNQAYLQCWDEVTAPISVTFKKACFQSATKKNEVELTLTEGHTILATEFDKYADDTKIKLVFENTTDPYESRNGWGIGGFANSDNWNPTYSINGLDGETFDVYVTVGDFKTAAKAGTDSYVDGQYHKAGVTFNIYNACKLTHVYALVEDGATNIFNTIAAPAATSAKTYNLEGQQVDASYKGVVIKGGKKFVQK